MGPAPARFASQAHGGVGGCWRWRGCGTVFELGEDFAQLCFPVAICRRSYCQPEDLAVISPVKHTVIPGSLRTARTPQSLPAATTFLSSARFRRNHLE